MNQTTEKETKIRKRKVKKIQKLSSEILQKQMVMNKVADHVIQLVQFIDKIFIIIYF